MKPALRPLCLAVGLFGAACSTPPPKPVPQLAVTDTRPIGEGLKVLAYAMVGGAVVLTLGKFLK